MICSVFDWLRFVDLISVRSKISEFQTSYYTVGSKTFNVEKTAAILRKHDESTRMKDASFKLKELLWTGHGVVLVFRRIPASQMFLPSLCVTFILPRFDCTFCISFWWKGNQNVWFWIDNRPKCGNQFCKLYLSFSRCHPPQRTLSGHEAQVNLRVREEQLTLCGLLNRTTKMFDF